MPASLHAGMNAVMLVSLQPVLHDSFQSIRTSCFHAVTQSVLVASRLAFCPAGNPACMADRRNASGLASLHSGKRSVTPTCHHEIVLACQHAIVLSLEDDY